MKDKKYGSMDKKMPGGWNGMIGELVRKVGGFTAGLGSILDTESKDAEDTAHSCILSVSKIHF